MIPSDSALERHWKRSCWVLSVWRQANSNNINYSPLNGHGWKQVNSNTLEIDWDSEDNITEVRTRVAFIKKGCGCKMGCVTNRCKCKRNNNHCGPGCACQSCGNLPAQAAPDGREIEVAETVDPGGDEYDSDLEAEVDDIMYRVFGGECEHARDSEHGERDSCGNISDHGDQSSEEEMDIDSIDA